MAGTALMRPDVRRDVDSCGVRKDRLPLDRGRRSVEIESGGVCQLLVIINLSQQGLMGECTLPPMVGDRIAVSLGIGAPVAGAVRWVRGVRIGVQFVAPIAMSQLRADNGRQASPREPRCHLNVSATAQFGSVSTAAIVRNASAKGLQIETSLAFRAGSMVTLKIEGMPMLKGHARWCVGVRTGLMLEQPLDEAELRQLRALM